MAILTLNGVEQEDLTNNYELEGTKFQGKTLVVPKAANSMGIILNPGDACRDVTNLVVDHPVTAVFDRALGPLSNYKALKNVYITCSDMSEEDITNLVFIFAGQQSASLPLSVYVPAKFEEKFNKALDIVFDMDKANYVLTSDRREKMFNVMPLTPENVARSQKSQPTKFKMTPPVREI